MPTFGHVKFFGEHRPWLISKLVSDLLFPNRGVIISATTVEATPILRPIGPILCYAMAALEVATGTQRLLFGLRKLRA